MRPDYATMPALVRDRLQKPRSVFGPGKRIRINILPMFFNIALPWGVFVFCSGITSFWVMYTHPALVGILIAIVVAIWLALLAAAIWTRINDPDPTWLSYLTLVVGAAILLGTTSGLSTYRHYSRPYFQVMDLKVVKNIDVATTPGSQLMDAGIFQFQSGNRFADYLSWHFKRGSTYCVAPIVSNVTGSGTLARYDVWAVGKDCCSLSASDFRCGAWGSVSAKSGIRVVSEGDVAMYRLAVQQAESLYNIMAPRPIFLEWAVDPYAEATSWNQLAFKNFQFYSVVSFVASVFAVITASCRFSWLGREMTVYSTDINDTEFQIGGRQQPMDAPPRAF